MRQITYGIFAEDAANQIFIENCIPQLVESYGKSGDVYFKHQKDYTDIAVAKNGQFVSQTFINRIIQGKVYYGLDVCFIGRDADDEYHTTLFTEMQNELSTAGLDEAGLIYVPVQAIEYWLWYIKLKQETPDLASTEPIETSRSRPEMKKLVYGRKKARNAVSNPIVQNLSAQIPIDWLRECSPSFAHFYKHFQDYLNTITTD